ncbi:MAG: hypothetical protein ACFFD4_07955 [Candidatus Odinarchaeota archaeon]
MAIKKKNSYKPTPLNSFFSSHPVPYTKTLEKRKFTVFNGITIDGYILKGRKALTIHLLNEIIKDRKLNTIYDALGRAKKKYKLVNGIDYEEVDAKLFRDFRNSYKYRDKIILLYPEGVLATLSALSGKFADELLIFLIRYYIQEENRKQLVDYTPDGSPFPEGNLISKDLLDCRSKNELIVANIFHDLDIVLRRKDYMSPDRFGEISRQVLAETGVRGLNFDFFVPLEPFTIVDVTTREKKNELKNAVKEEICKLEGWELFRIYEEEICNLPLLEQRIKKHFLA